MHYNIAYTSVNSITCALLADYKSIVHFMYSGRSSLLLLTALNMYRVPGSGLQQVFDTWRFIQHFETHMSFFTTISY